MNLNQLEVELKKRTKYQYNWGRKQNDLWDTFTKFIYNARTFDELIEKTESVLLHLQNAISISKKKLTLLDRQEFFNYAANRWYNFNSAKGVEEIFCSVDGIEPSLNEKDRLVDFTIHGLKFDHKTSVFPSKFGKDLNYALNHKRELIEWLYANQSQQQRKHLENRLFLIVYSSKGKHWKLKAELNWLKNIVLNYANEFNKENLVELTLKNNSEITYSDIIWAIN